MKKIYLVLAIAFGINGLQAQCGVDENNNVLGITPELLNTICVGKTVNQSFQAAVPNDTLVNLGAFSIDFSFDSVLISATDVPPGLNFSCPNGCKIYRQGNKGDLSRGCFTIFGTATTVSAPGAKMKINTKVWSHAAGSTSPYSYNQSYDIEYKVLDANDPLCTTTSLENFKINSSIEVYPNPAKGNATINLDLPSSSNVKVELFDVLGNNLGEIHNGVLNQGVNVLNTSKAASLESGLYMIKFEIATKKGTRVHTERLLVR